MDINNKTLQTNTFAGGMNTDVSDAFIEAGQYRMANNLRYVTNDQENTGEMHMIEGATEALSHIEGTVRGMISIRNYGVIVTEDDNKEWCILRWDTDSPDEEPKVIVKIKGHQLAEAPVKLSLVTKYEDDKNIKVYIADGENPMMCVNIMHEGDTIEDYNQIVSYPNVVLPPPSFNGLIDGTLKCGVVQYSYLLYNEWGTATDASIPTRLIPLHNKDVSLTNTSNFKGVEAGKTSNKGVSINITLLESFRKLRIFRISYVEAGLPPLIELIIDTTVEKDTTEYVLNDTGIEALQVYSLEEYNGIAGIHIIPKVIESKDDYMFAANIKTEQSEFDKLFDPVDFLTPQSDLTESALYDLKNPYIPLNSNIQYEGEYIKWNFCTQDFIGDDNGMDAELIKLPYGEYQGHRVHRGYDDPEVVYHYTSLRRDELYRYGIILYNNKGGHSSVFWIADVRTPSIYADDYKTFFLEDGKLKVRALGIYFKVDTDKIRQKLNNTDYDVVGYEIVRCNRTEKDIATIAQGVLSRPGRRINTDNDEAKTDYPLSPTGWLTTANIKCLPYHREIIGIPDSYDCLFLYTNCSTKTITWANLKEYAKDQNSIFLFVCPEFCYLLDQFKELTQQDSLYLRLLKYVYSSRFGSRDEDLPVSHAGILSYKPYTEDNEESYVVFLVGKYQAFNGGVNTGIEAGIGNLAFAYPGNDYTKFTYADTDGRVDIINLSCMSTVTYYEDIKNLIYGANQGDTYQFKKRYVQGDLHQYLKLYYNTFDVRTTDKNLSDQINYNIKDLDNINITDISYADAMNWDDLAETTASNDIYKLKYPDHIVNIGDNSFVNWVSTNLYELPVWNPDTNTGYDLRNKHIDQGRLNVFNAGIQSPGGKTVLLKRYIPNDFEGDSLTTTVWDSNVDGGSYIQKDSMLGTYLCNLRKDVVPYGGNSKEARKLSTYYSYGYYMPADQSGMDVYGGDCFIQPFEYVASHKCYHPAVNNLRSACIVYAIPVETNINLAYTYGYEFSKRFTKEGFASNLQDQPNDVNGIFIQDTPLYAYNAAYSSSNKLQLFSAFDEDETSIDSEDYRCYYSNPKSNNESIDSWTIFQPANFLDVDTRRGPITGLRTFHNNLVFWQREATGLFSVNERTAITDNSNMPLLLGTGGVLSRYDYINTSNGMRDNEFADTQSDTTLYWWDHNKADICAYAGGQESAVLSTIKNVSNFINKQEKEGNLTDTPALQFDKKYNEMIASISTGDNNDAGSLVYSERTQAFTSLYGINPQYSMQFADKLYLLTNEYDNDGKCIHQWNVEKNGAYGIDNTKLFPYLKYIVNDNPQINKVFDTSLFGGRVYGGGYMDEPERNHDALKHLSFNFYTPLKQESNLVDGEGIENVEYDFRFAIPRQDNADYGNRMRGKTMLCELKSDSNSLDLSIQYITTKYRISWS